MKFFGFQLPFIASIQQQLGRLGSFGFNTTNGKLIYRAAEGANGVKTLATTEDLAGIGGGNETPPYFVGQIVQSVSPQVPNGFIPFNGANLSKITHAALYAIFGDAHNDESTQEGYFKLPDARNKFLLYDVNNLGFTGGSAFITESNIPKMQPQLKVSMLTANSPSPNYLAVSASTNGDDVNVYTDSFDSELTDVITPIGTETPTAFYPPFLAVNTFVYSGVLF
jgi:microcystin-dependent protein